MSRNLPTLINRARRWMTRLYYGSPAIATYYPEPSNEGVDTVISDSSNCDLNNGVDNISTKVALSAVLGDDLPPRAEGLRLRYVKNRRRASGGGNRRY